MNEGTPAPDIETSRGLRQRLGSLFGGNKKQNQQPTVPNQPETKELAQILEDDAEKRQYEARRSLLFHLGRINEAGFTQGAKATQDIVGGVYAKSLATNKSVSIFLIGSSLEEDLAKKPPHDIDLLLVDNKAAQVSQDAVKRFDEETERFRETEAPFITGVLKELGFEQFETVEPHELHGSMGIMQRPGYIKVQTKDLPIHITVAPTGTPIADNKIRAFKPTEIAYIEGTI